MTVGSKSNVEEVEFTDDEGYGISDEEDLEDVVGMDRNGRAKAALENVMHSIEQNEIFQPVRSADNADLEEFFS